MLSDLNPTKDHILTNCFLILTNIDMPVFGMPSIQMAMKDNENNY